MLHTLYINIVFYYQKEMDTHSKVQSNHVTTMAHGPKALGILPSNGAQGQCLRAEPLGIAQDLWACQLKYGY